MKSIFMLAAANFRRHKGAGISLGLMVMIAALLLNLGTLSFTGLPRAFGQKLAALHAPYTATVLSNEIGSARRAQIEQFIRNRPQVTETQAENLLYFASASFTLKSGGSYSNTVLVENTNAAGRMGRLTFVGARGPQTDTSVYLPYILQAKGYRLGDRFTLTCGGRSYTLTVAGFTEDLMLGSLQTGGVRFYMPDAAYRRFASEFAGPGAQAVLFSARTRSVSDASDLYDTINRQTSQNAEDAMLIGSFSIAIVKLAVTMPVDIGAAMEIAFAFVVALVLLLVVRFRIVNSIEEDMCNIGALEAVGYTGWQVRVAFLLQFLTTAFLGGVGGVALSYAAAVPHGRMLVSETGLNWTQGFDAGVSLFTLAVLLLCVALAAFVSTARIRRLPVIVALRGGITTHSFRRNHLPLEKTRGPLNLLLACKTTLVNAKQNIALVVILAAVSFASIFTFLLFYNFGVDNTAVMHTMAGEPDDILIGAKTTGDAQSLLRELSSFPHVTQALSYDYTSLTADGKTGYGRVTPDYGKLKNDQTYAGRYPKHDNEAAVGGILAAQLHKSVGDSIRVSAGGASKEYIITGFTQSVSDIGKGIYLTAAGMRRLSPDFGSVTIFAYTDQNADIASVIHAVSSKYGAQINVISNDRASMESSFSTYESVVAAFAAVVFAVMGLLVVLILAFLTGALILRRRRELGIEKALGFTTRQLMRQVSFGFLPAALIGSLLGGLLGWVGANPLMSCLFRSMGIMKVEFYLPPASVPAACAVITLLTVCVSLPAAGRVRRVSPCVLMNE